jgi:hypothetical protein
VNVRAFPALPQDRRAALTAVSVPGALSAVEQPDLAVFLGIWTRSFRRFSLERNLAEPSGEGFGRSSAISRKVSRNNCWGMATSAIYTDCRNNPTSAWRPFLPVVTDERTLAASNPLDVEWLSGKGELVRLTD